MNKIKEAIRESSQLWRLASNNCHNRGDAGCFPNLCFHTVHGEEHPVCSVKKCPYWNVGGVVE